MVTSRVRVSLFGWGSPLREGMVDQASGSHHVSEENEAGRGNDGWLSDQNSDRNVSGRPGTLRLTGVIKTGSVGETWDEWDVRARLGCGLVCS